MCISGAVVTMATHGLYRTLDLAMKVIILKEAKERGTAKQDIARKYGIKPNNLSNFFKNKCSILEAFENDQFKNVLSENAYRCPPEVRASAANLD